MDGEFHESVTLVEHLIAPRCGLRLRAHVGVDQRKLLVIFEKKMDSWAKNTPNRHLEALRTQLCRDRESTLARMGTETEVIHYDSEWLKLLDPIMTIALRLSNPQDTVPLFLSLFALFERTFFDTTYLKLWIDYEPDDGAEVFLSLVDSFRGFVNLEKVYLGVSILCRSFCFPFYNAPWRIQSYSPH